MNNNRIFEHFMYTGAIGAYCGLSIGIISEICHRKSPLPDIVSITIKTIKGFGIGFTYPISIPYMFFVSKFLEKHLLKAITVKKQKLLEDVFPRIEYRMYFTTPVNHNIILMLEQKFHRRFELFSDKCIVCICDENITNHPNWINFVKSKRVENPAWYELNFDIELQPEEVFLLCDDVLLGDMLNRAVKNIKKSGWYYRNK